MDVQTSAHHLHLSIGSMADVARSEALGLPGKVFLREAAKLTSCEVSINRLEAGQGMPFVHAHRQNEEVYVVLAGAGIFFVDGVEFPVGEGSVLRIDPAAGRAWQAGAPGLTILCIQAKAGSLEQATRADGYSVPAKASWMT